MSNHRDMIVLQLTETAERIVCEGNDVSERLCRLLSSAYDSGESAGMETVKRLPGVQECIDGTFAEAVLANREATRHLTLEQQIEIVHAILDRAREDKAKS